MDFLKEIVKEIGDDFTQLASDIDETERYGSWLLIVGLLTRFASLSIIGTITVAIYHAIVTAGFNIYLLELLVLYLGGAFCVLCIGAGDYSIDRLIPWNKILRKIFKNKPHIPFM